jgi:hypothetical protein
MNVSSSIISIISGQRNLTHHFTYLLPELGKAGNNFSPSHIKQSNTELFRCSLIALTCCQFLNNRLIKPVSLSHHSFDSITMDGRRKRFLTNRKQNGRHCMTRLILRLEKGINNAQKITFNTLTTFEQQCNQLLFSQDLMLAQSVCWRFIQKLKKQVASSVK